MNSQKIRCSGCGQEGRREITGIVSNESARDVFTVQGRNPYSGKLYFRCPHCKSVIAVNPTDTLEFDTLTGNVNPLKSEVAVNLVREPCPLPVWGGLYSGLTLIFLGVKFLFLSI